MRLRISPQSLRLSSDGELVQLAQRQLPYVKTAFEVLVSRCQSKVFRQCLALTRDHAEAEDLTQEVFLRVFSGLRSFRGKSSFATWLYRIAANVCYSHLAKRKRSPNKEGPTLDDPSYTIDDSGYGGPLGDALSALSSEDQEVLVMRFVNDLSLDEIAQSLGVKLSAAKMRFYRALERFRSAFDAAKTRNL